MASSAPAPRALEVRAFGSARGHLMSRNVLALEYRHAESAQRIPYRHDFESSGVEMWALKDGSILLRHPRKRLWEDRIVGNNA